MVRALIALALWSSACAHAFDLEGHRGTRGLAPENTMAAFERALALGVTTIETDLAVTKDGVLVISHDPHLNPDIVRGPDGQWFAGKGVPIHSLTLAELRGYDIGRTNPASAYGKQFPEQQPADGQYAGEPGGLQRDWPGSNQTPARSNRSSTVYAEYRVCL